MHPQRWAGWLGAHDWLAIPALLVLAGIGVLIVVERVRIGDQFPSWSADGRRVLVTTNDGLAVIDFPSGRRTLIVRHGATDFGGAFSPDGHTLAFTHGLVGSQLSIHGDEPSSTLYVARADGTHARAIVGHESSPGTPSWAPSGRWLAFSGWNGVYLVREDGSALHRIYAEEFGTNPPPLAWSPDGVRLAFVDDDGGVYLLPVSGGRPTRVARLAAAAFSDTVAWAPTGKAIVFSATADGRRDGLFLLQLRRHRLTRLAAA